MRFRLSQSCERLTVFQNRVKVLEGIVPVDDDVDLRFMAVVMFGLLYKGGKRLDGQEESDLMAEIFLLCHLSATFYCQLCNRKLAQRAMLCISR